MSAYVIVRQAVGEADEGGEESADVEVAGGGDGRVTLAEEHPTQVEKRQHRGVALADALRVA